MATSPVFSEPKVSENTEYGLWVNHAIFLNECDKLFILYWNRKEELAS